MPLPTIVPIDQTISINSSDGRIFDFNTPSSRVYLGETINSLLRPFGKTCVLTGFNVKRVQYITSKIGGKINTFNEDLSLNPEINDPPPPVGTVVPCDSILVTLGKGECIIDNTFITYNSDTKIELDVSGYDESQGFLVLSIMFNFIDIMKKNYSKLMLSYVTNSGNIPNRTWYSECENIILAKIKFNKINKTPIYKHIDLINKESILIENKNYTIYPLDNISNRILFLLDSFFK